MKQQLTSAYPLDWPIGYKRNIYRKDSQFKNTLAGARNELKRQIDMLNGQSLIISSNVPLNSNGDLRADWPRFKIVDPGVAIFFNWKGKDITMCCDQYANTWENLVALSKAIEAIRGMERWGVSEFMERAFTGFTALPEQAEAWDPWEVLGIAQTQDEATIKKAYREKAKSAHPDAGGTDALFNQLQDAYARAIDFASAR